MGELEGVADTTGGSDSVGSWVAVGSSASVGLGAAEPLGTSEFDGDVVGEGSVPMVSGGFVALGVPDGAAGVSMALGAGSMELESAGDSGTLLGFSGGSVDSFVATLGSVGAAISDAVARDGVSTNAAITTPARPRLIRVAHGAAEIFIL